MRRGDLVTVALQGDLGKPRPALIVQSDLFDLHPSVVVLPVTSDLHDLPLFRVPVEPSPGTGLRQRSDIMVDKPQAVSRARLGQAIGRVDDGTLLTVDRLLALFLGIA